MNRTGSKILHGLLLATSGLVGSTIIASTAAMAGGGPTGGKVAVGSATIVNASPTQTVVNQASKKALINWNSFSIPSGSSVKFNQPTSKSLAVNRVTGPNASAIDGQLLANGNVWLINANGVLFGKGSQVNVGALLATTSDLSDDDFKAGNYNFKSAANPNAAVVNKGTITAGANGSVVLSAPRVSNEGLIHADVGTVVLGGAKAFTVDMTGDNLLRYEITAPVTDAPRDENGNVATALVSNSGKILAAGGQVMMTARAARNIQNNVINNTGMVEATTVSSHNGEIDLDAGPDGTVNDSGTLAATGTAQSQTGGTVNVTGGAVNVADGAKIDVSGNAGGGTVQIGGGLHGQGTLAHAQRTIIGGATITADATGKGNGGTVAVWSDGVTKFAGTISAKGGANGGNGGQVETSGHTLGVAPSANVDTSAPIGLTGDWLLDPVNLVISSCTSGQACCGSTCVDSASVTASLATTDITETASNSLTVDTNSDIVWNSAHSLSLLSQGDIDINSNLQNAGSGGINIVAGWDGTTTDFSGAVSTAAYGNGNAGNVSINAFGPVSVGSKGGKTLVAGYDVTVQSNSSNAQIGYRGTGGGEIDVLAKNSLSVISGASNTITRIGNGDIAVAGAVGGNININTDSLTVQANNSLASVIIGNAGAGGITGNIDISASGTVTLNETDTNSEAIIGNGDFDLSTVGNVGGDITVDAGNIDITGNVSAQSSIGNRGLASVSGNLDVETTVSDIQIVANDSGLASIGNRVGAVDGNNLVTGSSSGSIKVASSGTLAITANDSGQARIASGFAANTPINVTAAGTISLSVTGQPAQGGAAGQALIGNFGNYQTAAGGNITVTSTGGGISLSTSEENAFVGIGNTGGLSATGGNITVSALAPSQSITLDANANNALVQIGNSSSSGTIDGDITVASGDLFQVLSQATGSIAQIGNGGAFDQDYTGGNIAGTIAVSAGNGLQLSSGTQQGAIALIGNGDPLQGRAGNVSGDIVLNVTGTTQIDTNACATAWVGNKAGFSNVETGNLTIFTTSGSDLSGQAFLAGDLGSGPNDGGNVFVGFTDPNNGVSFSLGSYDSAHTFTVAAAGDLTIDDNIINDGSGDVNVVAGWDGHTTNLASLFNPDVANATAYGANQGALTIDDAFVGSAGGKTSVAGHSVTVDGTNGPAQIGYYDDGGGDIAVLAKTDVTVKASISGEDGGFAQIGNGSDGVETSTGNINVVAGGDVLLTGGEGGYFAQIGNGGPELNGTASGNISVNAGGSIELFGYSGPDATYATGYALIGNGGYDFSGDISGDIVVQAGGHVSLEGGGGASYAQIGNSSPSDECDCDPSGDISVTAAGAVTLSGGDGDNAYAQIGNGGAESGSALNAGNITVVAGDDLTLTSGYGDLAYAQIGNGGDGAYGTNSGNISVNVTGSISLSGSEDYAQIGNGGYGTGDSNGTINVSATGNIDLYGDSDSSYGYAQIGNGGDGSESSSGNITVSAGSNSTIADLTLSASDGYALIGNGGYADGDVSGDITVTVSGTTHFESQAEGADAWIGGVTGGEGGGGSVTGNVRIITGDIDSEYDDNDDVKGLILSDLMGGNVTIGTTDFTYLSSIDEDLSYTSANTLTLLAAGDFEISSNIQNGGSGAINLVAGWDGQTTDIASLTNASAYGNHNGSITIDGSSEDASVGSASGKTTVLGYDIHLTGGVAHAQIGYNGAATGNISVLAKHDIGLSGGAGANGSYGYAQIGNGGAKISGPDSGNIGVSAAGNITLTGGTGTYSYASIGNGGDTYAQNSSGNIAVTAGGSIALLGGTDYAQIGNGQWESNNSSGNIVVTAAQNITLTGASNSPWGYAQIGNGGYGANGIMSGNIAVTAGGTLSLTAGNNGMYAMIGNGGDENSFQNSASGNISIAGGNLTLTGAANASSGEGYAAIGNSATYNSGTAGSGIVSGNIAINVSGTTKIVSTSGQGDAWIGNAATPGGSQSGSVTVITRDLDDTADNNDDVSQFVVSDLGGGAVTFGITDAAAMSTIGGLNYTSSNALTVLSAGSIAVSGGIRNAGTGNLTLAAGWNPAILPANLLTASNAYSNTSASLTVSGVSTGGNLVLGSGGSIAQNGAIGAQNLTATARGAITLNNIGNRFTTASLSSGGNASLYDASGLTITGARIGGNLVLTSGGSIAQSGAINAQSLAVTASGAVTLNNTGNRFTTASLSSGGNASLYDASGLTISGASIGGNLVLTSGGSIAQSGAIGAQSLAITASGAIALTNSSNSFATASWSSGGNVSLYDAAALAIHGATYSNGSSLTLNSGGDIVFDGSVQNSGTGSITVVSAGNIVIGGATAGGGVAVGSQGGTTTFTAGNLLLSAVNGYAQLGYHGAGSGAIIATMSGNLTLTGGGSTGYYAQIGDGGYQINGSSSAATSVTAGGQIALNGGAGQEAYAQIGNGGAESNSNSSGYSETGLVTVNGQSVLLQAGSGTGSYAQIGHGGYKSGQSLHGTATLVGDVTVGAANAIRLIGGGVDAYAQIGQGGNFLNNGAANGSGGTISGNIAVAVAAPNTHNGNDPLTLTAGTGANSFAQIGNGGQGENKPAAGATVNFTIGGNVTVADLTLTGSNTGANGYAQIGNGDASKTGTGNISGLVTLGQGTDITYIAGTAPGASTGLGNATGFGTVTGTLPTGGVNAGTQGSVASITRNTTGPDAFNLQLASVTPMIASFNFSSQKNPSQGLTPLEQLADNANSEGQIASDSVAQSVGQSLGDGKTIYVTSKMLIPGMLKQIVTLTRNNPTGIPPADEDYSSWGNEALWRW